VVSTWAQKAEENIELFTNAEKSGDAARMLEITPANRILINREQAVILQIGRLMQSRFMHVRSGVHWGIEVSKPVVSDNPTSISKANKYLWIKELLDNVELHQATLDAKTRSDFKEVAISQGIAAMKKIKGELNNLAVK